jgi:predicted O-linked N-acetylglucosamine transferase (SPINDLY family)
MATQLNEKPLKRGALPAADRARLAEGQRLQQAGKLAEAEPLLRQVLQRHPSSFDALYGLGMFACQLGRYSDGVVLLRNALAIDPRQADALVDLARALHGTGDMDSALACVDMALEIETDDDEPRLLAADWLLAQQRRTDAERLLDPMLQQPGASAEFSLRAARAAALLGPSANALAHMDRAVHLGLSRAESWALLGDLYVAAGRWHQATEAFDRALAKDARSGAALCGNARALIRLHNYAAALSMSERAVKLDAGSVDAWNLHGAALSCLERYDESCEAFRRALQLDPNQRPTLSNLAQVLQTLHRYEDAALVFERLLAVWPDCEFAKGKLLHCKDLICDWLNRDKLLSAIERDIDAGLASAEPCGLQGYCGSPERLQRAARTFGSMFHADRSAGLAPPTVRSEGKIRIGYVSGEFRHQATSMLIVHLLELHDRERFEVYAFDNGYADHSSYRQRIEAAVTEVVAIASLSDEQASDAIRTRGIDILVDLNGYFGRARTDLFSLRPAAVQVNFLGFPGTLGVPYMDYLIADATIIPDEHLAYFDEAVVRMPDTYQPTDARRPVSSINTSRSEHGLPDQAFVFCNFNNSYKITPEVFSVWMRLLEAVPDSVLWLLEVEDAEAVRVNLVAEAQWRGISGDRLVFAPHVQIDQHLARLSLADLALDTLPYNAHTTGSDALWAGVPMVTCPGSSFAGRVGASLLRAAGLPELVTNSMADYQALALRLATVPHELAELRQRLVAQRRTAPLFDTDRYRCHLEWAYEEMVGRARLGQTPAPFDVPVQDAATPASLLESSTATA